MATFDKSDTLFLLIAIGFPWGRGKQSSLPLALYSCGEAEPFVSGEQDMSRKALERGERGGWA